MNFYDEFTGMPLRKAVPDPAGGMRLVWIELVSCPCCDMIREHVYAEEPTEIDLVFVRSCLCDNCLDADPAPLGAVEAGCVTAYPRVFELKLPR